MDFLSENVQRYFDFCQERHAIYLRRQTGAKWPWTDDLILQTYKFTNIYRQLDVGTIWLTENIIKPYANAAELFFNVASYRRYNYWLAAEAIGWIYDYPTQQEAIVERLRKYKALGGHVFTGAHMLNCQPGVDKITHVFEMVLPALWEGRNWIVDAETLQEVYERLLTINGFGPFLSYEVISDLRHTRYLKNASDIMTWANAGPGAKRGIMRLMGLPVKGKFDGKRPNDNEYLGAMRALLELSKTWLLDWMPAWEMREVEHSLCEYDKYERVRLGEGRPRARYHHEG